MTEPVGLLSNTRPAARCVITSGQTGTKTGGYMVIAALAGQLHGMIRHTEPFSALGIYGTLLFFLLYLQAASSSDSVAWAN